MPDYSKSKIYKIVANTDEEYSPYIGSTVKQYLRQRFAVHKSNYINYKNGKTNFTSSYLLFDKYGIENCEIVLVEDYPCATKDELHARERYWFDNMENCNINKPAKTEYEKQNLWKLKYQRELELHPDYNKKQYQRKLELHPDHKTTRTEIQKEARKEKYICECGTTLQREKKSRHEKSKKHLNYIATIAIQQEV